MKSESLSLKTIIKKLDFLKEAVFIQWNASKKDLLLLVNKSIEKVPDSLYTEEQYQSFIRKKKGWIIDTVTDHTIGISKYNPLAGSSYIKLLKELDHPRKGLVNIQWW